MTVTVKAPVPALTNDPSIVNVDVVMADDAVSVVVATTSIAPVIVKVPAPLMTAVPAPIAEVVIEVNDRLTFIASVPPCSIIIVFPTGIVLAFTVEPLIIVVCASVLKLKKRKLRRTRKFVLQVLLSEVDGINFK
jgi:hypothetical protein